MPTATVERRRRRDELARHWRAQLDYVTALSILCHTDGTTRRERRSAQRRLDAARHALIEIEAAIKRLDAAGYAHCRHCGRPISTGLLLWQPDATWCRDCSRVPAQAARHV